MAQMEQERVTAELFSDWAATERGEAMATGHEPLVEPVLSSWSLSGDSYVLDIGCGVGKALEAAQAKGAGRIAGIDLSGKMIEAASTRLPKADLRVGSVLELPWEGNQFTHAISIEALYYLEEPEIGLQEIWRVMKNGGTFSSVIEYFKENQASQLWSDTLPMNITNWNESQWVDAFRTAGFQNIESTRIVRGEPRNKEEFKPSSSFPSYEMYLDYVKQGALWVRAEK